MLVSRVAFLRACACKAWRMAALRAAAASALDAEDEDVKDCLLSDQAPLEPYH